MKNTPRKQMAALYPDQEIKQIVRMDSRGRVRIEYVPVPKSTKQPEVKPDGTRDN